MSQVQLLTDLSNDAVFFACAGSVAFLAVYLLLARGWRTEIGRALIMLDAGLTLALGPSVIHRLAGLSLASLDFAWYYVASITLVGAATWWRTWFVVKVQARGAGMTPRQFGWHLLCGIAGAARRAPAALALWWRKLREPPQAGGGDDA
jgi:hypothetical protein